MKYTLFTQANAQEAAPAAASNEMSFTSFVPLILIFAVFYFLIIRPQSKKMKEHQAALNALKINDKVITNGGIVGVISKIDEKENILEIEIADDVKVKVLRNYIASTVQKEEKNKK